MYEHGLIAPVVALIVWSLVMLVWLYATRIPAMLKLKLDPEKLKDAKDKLETLPVHARRVAANYNHLMEQPTLFYAVCFALQFIGQTHEINIGLAWAYVAIRVAHSLVQASVNIIRLRFSLFILGTLMLMALTTHAAVGVFAHGVHLPH